MDGIVLRSYAECDPAVLGTQLAGIVEHGSPWLEVDFPALPHNYGTPSAGQRRVAEITGQILRSQRRYNAFAVYCDSEVVGSVSYAQRTLRVRTRLLSLRGERLARGPLVAGWLAATRRPEQRRLAPTIMVALAREIALMDGHLSGKVWTAVRPAHTYVTTLLTDASNAFGGFDPVGLPRSYKAIDGVAALRQLYVSRFTVARLAVEYR